MSEVPNLPLETDQQPEPVTPPQPVSEPTVPPITEPTPPADPVDYATKFSESTRENQILREKLNALEGTRKDLTNEPTDSELQAAIPGWEFMDDGQKSIARRALNAERIARDLAADRDERRAEQQWNTDLELAIAKNPSLQGKEQGFKEYANKPSHRGAPMEVLVDAFLHRATTPTPMNTPTPAAPQPTIEQPNGGPRGTEQPKQLDAEALKTLRETDERAYNEYIRTHDIDFDQLLA